MSSVDTRVGLFDKAPTRNLFVSSRQLTLLDHFRIPYEVDARISFAGVEQLCGASSGPAVLWSKTPAGRAIAARVLAADRETEVPLFARVLADHAVEPLLAERGGSWHRAREVTGPDGAQISSIWRSEDGNVFLPFDPDEVIHNYWSERYVAIRSGTGAPGLRRGLLRAYYRIRPLIPRSTQIWVRRHFARAQARSRFPRWPIETGLHDFFDLMLAIVSDAAREPVPAIAPWPNGYIWALVLTHDVELADGLAAVEPVLELEHARARRSSWNLVARDYAVDPERVRELLAQGLEVGVHGLSHDGRDLESLAGWQARLPHIREAAVRWEARGFRSPAMHRRWEWMPLLGLDYDSSYPDTDPFEPQPGGCCTWLPFFNEGLVELPVTLPQDHTLFVILGQDGEAAWIQKARFLRSRGGMALVNTHPDYLVDERILGAYGGFLDQFATDGSAWNALPREVSSWWRRRAASWLEGDGDRWQVLGPASGEARVEFLGGTW